MTHRQQADPLRVGHQPNYPSDGERGQAKRRNGQPLLPFPASDTHFGHALSVGEDNRPIFALGDLDEQFQEEGKAAFQFFGDVGGKGHFQPSPQNRRLLIEGDDGAKASDRCLPPTVPKCFGLRGRKETNGADRPKRAKRVAVVPLPRKGAPDRRDDGQEARGFQGKRG
jgi:hypothetical protein